MDVTSLQSAGTQPAIPLPSTQPSEDTSFTDILQRAVESVNETQKEADTAARNFAIGEAESLHGTMIAVEKADITLRLFTQLRNKVVDAYQEVMRMQI